MKNPKMTPKPNQKKLFPIKPFRVLFDEKLSRAMKKNIWID